jgi:hypothetical protein
MTFQDHQMLVWHLKINAQILFVHVSEATQPGTNLFQHIPSHFDKIKLVRARVLFCRSLFPDFIVYRLIIVLYVLL